MSSKYTLYDLPSKDPCRCWSMNPWKTRMLFNYKKVPYETQWVEYPEITPTLEKHLPPHSEGTPYTIPAVRFPDGSYLQESRLIAERVEKEYPNAPLDVSSQASKDFEKQAEKVISTFYPELVNKIQKRILREASVPYWYQSREKSFGMSLDQVEKEIGGEKAYQAVAPLLQEVTKQLKANTSGPFFGGDRVDYSDFVWAGFLQFMKRTGDDVLGRLLEVSGDAECHLAHLKACGPWIERDDH